jgi:hypothetical protein
MLVNPKAQYTSRGGQMLHLVSAYAVAKLAWFGLNKWASATVIGLWLFAGTAFFHATYPSYLQAAFLAVYQQYLPPPTVPEMERHLESDDKRLDVTDARIEKRFDELNEDRKERKKESDDRYRELNERVSTIWYGLGGIGVLLSFGIIKLKPLTGIGPEDTRTLTWFANELRNSKQPAERKR